MELIEYLKQPQLVANIQRFFGIKLKSVGAKNGLPKISESKKEYEITNRFWYYLFTFGTALGDEVFYSCFIPFWFWNVDGAVGRRMVMVWMIVMYIGQAFKDIIRWERPGPPVVKLQTKWALEYGMPSTHAMVGVSIPFSVFLYTMSRYQYCTCIGLTVAISWCSIICVSRLYLGMHTILDIIAGLLLAVILMVPAVPLVDRMDNYLLTNTLSPLIVLVVSILMIVYYPNSGKWTPTRGDTTMIVSVSVGLHFGSWLNYQSGIMTVSELRPPYTILWPSMVMLGYLFLRTLIGFSCVLITRILASHISYNFLCTLLRENVDNIRKSENSLHNKHKNFVELGCKYFTCALIGFNMVYLLPHLFRALRIERPTFYTEI